MKKISLIFLVLLLGSLFTSCANLSKNSVREGSFVVRNGTAGDKVWKENLTMKRVSWTHELTLQFDLMMVNIPPQSGFNFWFSKAELDDVNSCGDFRLVMVYSLDTKVIPYSYFNEQIENAGFKKIEINNFKKQFMQHPDSEMSSLRLYQVYGICRANKDLKPLILNFPGFSEKVLN